MTPTAFVHNASVHFMTDTAIQHVFGETFNRNLGNKPRYETRIIRDYKATPFERGACINYDFSGRPHISPVTAEPAPGGFVTSIPAYVVREGRYCPGLYQSMALPTAQLIGTNPTFIGHQQQFGDTVKQRLEYEKTAFDSTAALVRANPRQAILPPDVSNIMHDIDTTL